MIANKTESSALTRSTAAASPAHCRSAPRTGTSGHPGGRNQIARSRVTAPVDEEILKLNARRRIRAAGITPKPLLLLGGVEPMHPRVDVDEQEAWRVEPGAKAGEDRNQGEKVRRSVPNPLARSSSQ